MAARINGMTADADTTSKSSAPHLAALWSLPVHEVFVQQARLTPDALAVEDSAHRLSYKQLEQAARCLAHRLGQLGVSPGENVAIIMARSIQLVVAELAVMMVGCAYVPLDPELPTERREFILADCQARFALVREPSGSLALAQGVLTVDCGDCAESRQPSPLLEGVLSLGPYAPAYVMYTSGSTGIPKGVVVSHGSIVRLARHNSYVEIRPGDCVAFCSNPAFDASTFEIWGALLNGARAQVIPQRELLDTVLLGEFLARHEVDVSIQTTALLNQHVSQNPAIFRRLRYLLFGGEAADANLIRRLLSTGAPENLIHVYGPTETTTFATWWKVEGLAEDARTVPIGRPITGTQIHLLASDLSPAPSGETGEIYIGGEGVAQGYLNRPALTAEKFLADPFSAIPGSRHYRSGDIARWSVGGDIEFVGRLDFQVKLRGYRIELGDIEDSMSHYRGVMQAVAMIREDRPGERRIVGYVVKSDATVSDDGTFLSGLRGYLRTRLPGYMIPAAILVLESLPLTPNGKLDRARLPVPGTSSEAMADDVEPLTPTEFALREVWRDVLNVPRVGIDENFFEVGGQSLLAMTLTARIARQWGVRLPAFTVFEHRTVRKFAALLDTLSAGEPQVVVSPTIQDGVI